MPQRETMCTLSGFTETSVFVLKTLHTVTQFHLRILINQKALCQRHHTHTNRQLIFTKHHMKSTNILSVLCLFHTYTYTLKQFSLHIHEVYSLIYLKSRILRVSIYISNMFSGYGLVTQPTRLIYQL